MFHERYDVSQGSPWKVQLEQPTLRPGSVFREAGQTRVVDCFLGRCDCCSGVWSKGHEDVVSRSGAREVARGQLTHFSFHFPVI